MKIEYSEKARKWGESPTGQIVAKELKHALRRATDPIEIRWDRVEDANGRPVYELTLSDPKASVTERFTPDEVETTRYAWDREYRLIRLWGDLQQVWSHQLLEEMKASRD